MNQIRSIASFIPAAWRTVIYSALGTLILLEGIWDLVPDVAEGKLLKTASVLGFGMAAVNALPPPPPPPAPPEDQQLVPNFPDEFP